MRSIQSQLMWSILASAAVLLLAAGLLIESLLRAQLEREFDRGLLAKTMTLVTLTDQEDGKIEFDSDKSLPQFSATRNAEYFELWLDSGEPVERSLSLGIGHLPRTDPPLDEARFDNIRLPDGRDGRLVELKFIPFADPGDVGAGNEKTVAQDSVDKPLARPLTGLRAVVVLAVARGNLDGLIFAVRVILLTTMAAVLGAAAVIVRFAVKRGLQPLREVARWVQDMDVDNLDARIQLDHKRAELAPITKQLNNLLGRLDDAFEREKRFSGNVAHELRTPLAELRSLADVGRKWPEDRALVATFFEDVGIVAGNMEMIVANLFALAKCDAGKLELEEATIELGSVVNETWLKVLANAKSKNVELDNGINGPTLVRTDPAMLELMLLNLMTNAVEYSPKGSAVSISAHQNATTATLSITNIARDLEAGDLPSLFDRFWRKETARTGGQHAGLGLSLVKSLANALRLGVSPRLDENDYFSVALSDLRLA